MTTHTLPSENTPTGHNDTSAQQESTSAANDSSKQHDSNDWQPHRGPT